jgi:hypothetical protein
MVIEFYTSGKQSPTNEKLSLLVLLLGVGVSTVTDVQLTTVRAIVDGDYVCPFPAAGEPYVLRRQRLVRPEPPALGSCVPTRCWCACVQMGLIFGVLSVLATAHFNIWQGTKQRELSLTSTQLLHTIAYPQVGFPCAPKGSRDAVASLVSREFALFPKLPVSPPLCTRNFDRCDPLQRRPSCATCSRRSLRPTLGS